MSFRITGLDPTPFRHLWGADEATLAAAGALRRTADSNPGFPCRVSLRDAEPGEDLLLLHYEHLSVSTPYRSSHAIYVTEGAEQPAEFAGEVPPVLSSRLLSARAFDAEGMMRDAEVIEGSHLAPLLDRWLDDLATDFVDLHNARPGCFAARVRRG